MRDDLDRPDDHRCPQPTRRAVLGAALLGAAATVLLTAAPHRMARGASTPLVPRTPPPAIRFDVIRAGRPIGRHEVDFRTVPNGYAVRTSIDIAVRILGVTVFVYRHTGTETWVGGRLSAFDSETQDDDSAFFVVGRATADGFLITHRKGSETAPADIMVGSYWTREIALRPLLIDPQRGRLKDQQLLGTDTLQIMAAGTEVTATRYHLSGVTNGWVAYDDRGHWLAAELKKKGSDILYTRAG
jgi:hypothetical protein